MSYPHYDLVQRAHQELLAEGKIKTRATQEETEADKGLLTARSAWYVYSERDPSHGLLSKTSGNSYLGLYSVDWITRKTDGEGWDIVSDSGGLAIPVDGGPLGADPARIAEWREPSAALAQLEDAPEPPPVDETTLDDVYAYLEVLQVQQAEDTQLILARDDANTQRILDTIDSIKTQVEESLQKALALIVIHRRREDEPVP